MKYSVQLCLFVVITILMFSHAASTQESKDFCLSNIYTDHMVLQRDLPARIWGYAQPGDTITVDFAGQSAGAKVDKDGVWKVELKALAMSSEGRTLIANSKNEGRKLQIDDVLVGDVWVVSGQSNAGVGAGAATDIWQFMQDKADMPLVRMVKLNEYGGVDGKHEIRLQQDVELSNPWGASTAETAERFPGIGWYFAYRVHHETGVPLGMIRAQKGGLIIESYMSEERLRSFAQGRAAMERKSREGSEGLNHPTSAYKTMIYALSKFPIKGVLWYQGESNARYGYDYRFTLARMISFWRDCWCIGDFAFYIVQLPENGRLNNDPNEMGLWPDIRESQHVVVREMKNVELACIIDTHVMTDDRLVDPLHPNFSYGAELHPGNKYLPGLRLARIALARDYSRNTVYRGPTFKEIKIEGCKITLTFDNVAEGLTTGKRFGSGENFRAFRDTPVRWIAVANADKTWHWERARIVGKDTVVIDCKAVKQPVAVRYAWKQNPLYCNLYNSAGLPAVPFRTDNWPAAERNRIE